MRLVRIGTKNIYLTADIGLTDRIWGENEPSLTCAFEGQEYDNETPLSATVTESVYL